MLPQMSVFRRVSFWVTLSLAFGLLAVFLGLVGAFAGWFIQLFILIITIPIVLMLVDYRLGLMLAVLLLPYGDSPLIPKAGPLSLLNVLLLGVCLAFVLRWLLLRLTGRHMVLPTSHELGWLYLLPLTVAMFIGTPHLSEISRQYLNYSHIEAWGLKEYWVSLYPKMILLVAIGYIHGPAVAERGNGIRFAVTTVVSGVLFSILIFVVIGWAGASLGELNNTRSFLSLLGNHSNQASQVLIVPLGCALFMREMATNRLARNSLLVATLIMAAGTVFTFSRGGVVSMLFVLGFYVWHFKRVGLGLAVLTIVVSGFAVAPDAIRDRMMRGLENAPSVSQQLSSGTAGGDELTAGRIWVWRQLAPEILRSPLVGRGVTSTQWSEAAKDGRLYYNQPHNLYLEMLMDLGLVGTVCIVLFYRYVWKQFLRLSEDERLTPAMRGYFLGAAAGLLGMLAFGMTGGHYFPSSEQLFFWVCIGLALGYHRYLATQPAASVPAHVPSGMRRSGFHVPETSILRPR